MLDAELIADPGAEKLYASGNPLILGAILEQALVDPVEWFAHRRLLLPLGVERFAS